MKDLKSVLKEIVGKPLKKVTEESTVVRRSCRKVEAKRLDMTAFRQHHAAEPVTLSKGGQTFFFLPTTEVKYEFEKNKREKSLKIRLQVAEWTNDKIIVYAQHIWVGYQCSYVQGLVRGVYMIDQVYQGEVAMDWQPTKAEQDPSYSQAQAQAQEERRGHSSSAYGWEGIDD